MVLLTTPTGGRRYLRVSEIINKEAEIIDEATLEEAAFTKPDDASDIKANIKTVLRVPVRVYEADRKRYIEGIWTPGKYAQFELQKVLGNETKEWIGAQGVFEERKVEDRDGKRYLAVFFRVTKRPEE